MTPSLRSVRVRLNGATERLNAMIADIEKALQRLNIGVEAWVTLNDELQMGYYRHGDRWRLCVSNRHIVKPLVEANRLVRADAIPALPTLFATLEQEAVKLLEKTEKATRLAEDMVSGIHAAMAEMEAAQ